MGRAKKEHREEWVRAILKGNLKHQKIISIKNILKGTCCVVSLLSRLFEIHTYQLGNRLALEV